MTIQRTLRSSTTLSHSTVAVSTSSHRNHSSEKKTLVQGPEAVTVPSMLAKTSRKRSRKPEGDPASPLAKIARVQAPEPQERALSKLPQNNSRVASDLPNDISESSFDRPARPNRTNATLLTPRGSRLVPYDQATAETSIPRPTTTTSHILDEACAHLIKMEPMLQPLIDKHYCRVFCPEGLAEECDPFRSLCSSIMAQQVSGAAASSIKRKFVGLFNRPIDEEKVEEAKMFPTPAQVAACSVAFLRQAGLSQRKAEYIQGLAEKFSTGELSATMLINASDEEVLEKLTAVRGLGRWSVEMFACFGLKRMDIISTGDLGVQRGMAAFMGKDVKKLKAKGGGKWKYMSEQDMLKNSEKFAPYRSVFMWYMWRVEDVDINVVEEA